MSQIGRIEIEIAETDDPGTRAVRASVAKGGAAYTKRITARLPEDRDARGIIVSSVNQLLGFQYEFLADPAAHADPIEPSRDAESACPIPPPREPALRISLPGTLRRAAHIVEMHDDSGLGPSLLLLLEHLRALRAEPARLGEFLATWADERDAEGKGVGVERA